MYRGSLIFQCLSVHFRQLARSRLNTVYERYAIRYMDQQHTISSSEDRIFRITVADVLDWVSAGLTNKDIARQFPEVPEQEIERYIVSLGFR